MKPNIKWTGGFTIIEVIVTIVALAILGAMMVPYFGTSFNRSGGPVSNLIQSRANQGNDQSLNPVMEKFSAQGAQIPHWRPQTSYGMGTIILPTTRIRNGFRYSTAGGGTSGTIQPAWPLSGNVADGTITWTNIGIAPSLAIVLWSPNTTYSVGSIIIPTMTHWNGFCYSSNASGTTGATEPTWPTTIGNTVTDNTITWTNAGAPQVNLQNQIGAEGQNYTNTFGSYRVINNHFITFNASNVEQLCASSATCLDYGRYLKVTIGFRSDDPNRTGDTLTTLFVLR